eukprot:CAMPEP_0117002288 /NCGR_PEP_ID=MMETSP0472-20121206/4015_1 /TAXON_ID=693140 ORGANISM="Tiarina fusus, Strain LIS" /NCGR_SAMPLE_ID=MMETSP0472 /ASSEMBLY_ACC=CAM_ASM_000603 /LENGTH=1027 /DNA_ID=CAMNT_0004702601 /DNA_START=138 /DNA_END=3221 /DNA_ORIENTATION=+
MIYSDFDEVTFRASVDDAMKSVDRILQVHRNPRLPENVDHNYSDKYALADLMTNVGIIAQMNCLERMGLSAEILQGVDKTKATTLRFQSSETCTFLKETEVKVPMERTVETVEDTQTTGSFFGKTTKATISRVVNRVKEYHWKVDISWQLFIFSGTNTDDKTMLQSRQSSTTVVIQSKEAPFPGHRERSPVDVSLTWLLQQIDTKELVAQFKVDTLHPDTKTPLRNKQVEDALDCITNIQDWAENLHDYFGLHLQHEIFNHDNPAAGPPAEKAGSLNSLNGKLFELSDGVFNPIHPLVEERPDDSQNADEKEHQSKDSILGLPAKLSDDDSRALLLSKNDMTKIMNEHVRSLDEKIGSIRKTFPAKNTVKRISTAEAEIALLADHLRHLMEMYVNSVGYNEWMLEQQLVAAIGKRVDSADLDKFVKFHNVKLLQPAPKPFCHSIRRPDHYPDGVLSIEGVNTYEEDGKKEPIDTFVRHVEMAKPLQIPLSAAATLELTGKSFLHGWLQHRFENTSKTYELVARARQFSSFMLIVGTMAGSDKLDPKDAIILQNKDEVIIPLLLDELPSAKEFKDAIQSLSPEQQRFAKSFRSMQLESSVLGVCIIQIKPQLEKLLGLPPDALTKEMKLTQDLMQLFVEYQVPSDLLSYDGDSEHATVKEKVENVKTHVQSVMGVVDAAKDRQLEEQTKQAENAFMQRVQYQSADAEELSRRAGPPTGGRGGGRSSPMLQSRSIRADGFHSSSMPFSMAGMPGFGGGAYSSKKSKKKSGAKSGSSAASLYFQAPAAATTPTQHFAAGHMIALSMDTPVSTLEELQCQREVIQNIEKETDRVDDSFVEFDHSLSKVVTSESVENSKTNDPKSASESGLLERKGKEDALVDFTKMPKILDALIEQHDTEGSLRSTVVKTSNLWVRNRQENLLSKVRPQTLGSQEIKSEKDKAFDLLDALSRSGSLPIASSELHVIICLTHRFEKDVMGTVIQDNINPIEKLEMSTLLFASAVHGVAPKELVRGGEQEANRLAGSFPLLLK